MKNQNYMKVMYSVNKNDKDYPKSFRELYINIQKDIRKQKIIELNS
jgi:hypothetical protein